MLVIPKLRIGYQDSPKIASTTLFEWLHQALYGYEYDGHVQGKKKIKVIHSFFRNGLCVDAVLADNTKPALVEYDGYYRFTLTRDPVKRFLSMYSNRVVHYRELSATSRSAKGLLAAGLSCDPQINELVASLDEYMRFQPSIFHHARPQMDFIGPDLAVYSRIADISDSNKVMADIRAYWERNGMVDALGRMPVELPRRQTGGPKLGLGILTQESFEKLLEYYGDDYEKIPTLNLEAVKEEYFRARKSDAEYEPIIFPVQQHNEHLSRQQADTAAQSVVIDRHECSAIQVMRLNVPESGITVGTPFVLKGAVVLRPGVAEGGWCLAISDGVKPEKSCQWSLPSPSLSEKFPDNRYAINARFRVSDVCLQKGRAIEVSLLGKAGERYKLFTISLKK